MVSVVDDVLREAISKSIVILDTFHVAVTEAFLNRAYSVEGASKNDTIAVDKPCEQTYESLCRNPTLARDCYTGMKNVWVQAQSKLNVDTKEMLKRIASTFAAVCSELHFTEVAMQFLAKVPDIVVAYYESSPSIDPDEANDAIRDVEARIKAYLESDAFRDIVPDKMSNMYTAVSRKVLSIIQPADLELYARVLGGVDIGSGTQQTKMMLFYLYSDLADIHNSGDIRQGFQKFLNLVFHILMSYTSMQHRDLLPGLHSNQVTEILSTLKGIVNGSGSRDESIVQTIANDRNCLYADFLHTTYSGAYNIHERCVARVHAYEYQNVSNVELPDTTVNRTYGNIELDYNNIAAARVVVGTDGRFTYYGNMNTHKVSVNRYIWIRFVDNTSVVRKGTFKRTSDNGRKWILQEISSTERPRILVMNILTRLLSPPAQVSRGELVAPQGMTPDQLVRFLRQYNPDKSSLLSDYDLAFEINKADFTSDKKTVQINKHQLHLQCRQGGEYNKTLGTFDTCKKFLDIISSTSSPILHSVVSPMLKNTPFNGQVGVFFILLSLIFENMSRRAEDSVVMLTTIMRGVFIELQNKDSMFNRSKTYAESSKHLLRAVLGNVGTFLGKMFQTVNEVLGDTWTNLVGPKLKYPELSQGEIQAMLLKIVEHELRRDNKTSTTEAIQRVFMASGMRIRPKMLANASVGQVHILERVPSSRRSCRDQFYHMLGKVGTITPLEHTKFKTYISDYLRDTRRVCQQPVNAGCAPGGFHTKIFRDNKGVVRSSRDYHWYELHNHWKTVDEGHQTDGRVGLKNPTYKGTIEEQYQTALESRVRDNRGSSLGADGDGNTREYYCEATGEEDQSFEVCELNNDSKLRMRRYTPNTEPSTEECKKRVAKRRDDFISNVQPMKLSRSSLDDFLSHLDDIVSSTGRNQYPPAADVIQQYVADQSRLVVKFVKPRTRVILCFEEALITGALKLLYKNSEHVSDLMKIVAHRESVSCTGGQRGRGNGPTCVALCMNDGIQCGRTTVAGTPYCQTHGRLVQGLSNDDLDEIERLFVDSAGYIAYPFNSETKQARFVHFVRKSNLFVSGIPYDRKALQMATPWFSSDSHRTAESTNMEDILKSIRKLYAMTQCKFRSIREEFDLNEEFKMSNDAQRTYGRNGFFVPKMYSTRHLLYRLPSNTDQQEGFSPVIIQDFVPGKEIEAYKSMPNKGADAHELAALSHGLTRFGAMFLEQLLVNGKGHGDPHPGNMKFAYDRSTRRGVVGILDFGDWISLSADHRGIIQAVGKAYLRAGIHYHLAGLYTVWRSLFGQSTEDTTTSDKLSLSDVLRQIMTIDGTGLTVNSSFVPQIVGFVTSTIVSVTSFAFTTVWGQVWKTIMTIGEEVVKKGVILGGMSGAIQSAVPWVLGSMYVSTTYYKGFNSAVERSEFLRYHRNFVSKIVTLGVAISASMLSMLSDLVETVLLTIDPSLSSKKGAISQVLDTMENYASKTSMQSIMDTCAREVLSVSGKQSKKDDIMRLSYFMQAYVTDEIETKQYGRMFSDEKLMNKFQSLAAGGATNEPTTETVDCQTLSMSLMQVGQAVLKYYNNFAVLRAADNCTDSMGMSSIFQVIPLMVGNSGLARVLGTVPTDVEECEDCDIVQTRVNKWKDLPILDFVQSEIL